MTGAALRPGAVVRHRLALTLGSFMAICATAIPAAAQPAEEPVGVANRPRPDYDPIGEKLGALLLNPQLSVDVQHTDNVFATSANRVSDTYVRVAPRLTLKTNWPRHSLVATAEGRFNRYDELKTQDTDEWSAGLAGGLDVTRDLKINLNLAHDDRVEPRGSTIYSVTPLEPVTYTRDLASLSISQAFNRLRIGGSVSRSSYDFDATRDVIGAILDQSFRDRDETELKLRLGYAVSPKTAFFVEGGTVNLDYDTRTLAGGSRDSSSKSVLFGIEGELTRLIRGEASVGFVHYDFDNPAYNDTDNFNYKLALEWYPTDLLTVGLVGSQALHDTPLVTIPGSINRSLTLTADYELRRNLIISGRLMAGDEDYQGLGGPTVQRYGGTLAARYLVYRGVGLTFRYDHEQRDASGVSGAGYRDNTMGVGVTLAR